MQKIAAVCVFVFLVFFVLVIITSVTSYSGLVGASQTADEQWVAVQAACKSRADLISYFMNSLSGAVNIDKSTLAAAADARASLDQVKIDPGQAPTDQSQLDQFQAAQARFSTAVSRLLASSGHAADLQAKLEADEKQIADGRRKYNETARDFNRRIRRFPVVLVAHTMGFYPMACFREEGATGDP